MKEQIIERLKKIEVDLDIYFKYVNDPTVDKKNRSVVSFKLMNEMLAFQTLKELVPEYVPAQSTGIVMAQGMAGVTGLVSIEQGQVRISSDYETLLKQKEEYLNKNNPNGKVD